jgi:hypothetical protein
MAAHRRAGALQCGVGRSYAEIQDGRRLGGGVAEDISQDEDSTLPWWERLQHCGDG